MSPPLLTVDGSLGEGGGQILRTSVTLAATFGRPVRVENVRAGRGNPGLAAQHLTAVRATAAVCRAHVEGDELGSTSLTFAPGGPPRAGSYAFDVAEAREGGSAGSATLVLQAVLLALAAAEGDSTVTVRGGTHVPWSPSLDFLTGVWLPYLQDSGVEARIDEVRTGWYPAGGGEILARVRGRGIPGGLAPLELEERGALLGVRGRALAANLPAHVADRMAGRARSLLAAEGVPADVRAERVRASTPGAAIFLAFECEGAAAGFSSLGRRGKPAERVAEQAVEELLAHRRSGAALDRHLGDQVLLITALAGGRSAFTVERVTEHLRTNAHVIECFGLAAVDMSEEREGTGRILVHPS